MMTLVAPVPRTASTSSCIPAAVKLTPRQDPPSRQQRQASGVSALLSGNGSLKDRKSTRLNSSHLVISYAVFCLKKKQTVHMTPLGPAPSDRPAAPPAPST